MAVQECNAFFCMSNLASGAHLHWNDLQRRPRHGTLNRQVAAAAQRQRVKLPAAHAGHVSAVRNEHKEVWVLPEEHERVGWGRVGGPTAGCPYWPCPCSARNKHKPREEQHKCVGWGGVGGPTASGMLAAPLQHSLPAEGGGVTSTAMHSQAGPAVTPPAPW